MCSGGEKHLSDASQRGSRVCSGRNAGMLLLHKAMKSLGQFRCVYGKPFNTAGVKELGKSFTRLHPTVLKTLSTFKM